MQYSTVHWGGVVLYKCKMTEDGQQKVMTSFKE